jgi:hypothetical protein
MYLGELRIKLAIVFEEQCALILTMMFLAALLNSVRAKKYHKVVQSRLKLPLSEHEG